jgi:hypothetical protein
MTGLVDLRRILGGGSPQDEEPELEVSERVRRLELLRMRSFLVPMEESTPDEIKALDEEPKEYISEEELVNSLRKRVKSDSKRQVHNKGPRSI